MKPKVSIIMATYNRAHFIVETLRSIQKQTYLNWECLIIDDGGIDSTFEVIAPILQKDKRFDFFERPESYKKGLPGCRNYGLDLAKGEYVIFFDDDDIVHPDNLKFCLQILADENVDFCHYQKQAFEGEKPKIEKSVLTRKEGLTKTDIEKVVTQKIGLASCTMMWKSYCFDKVRFNENLLYAEEWECYNRIISDDFKGTIIDSILYYNRKHADSNTAEFYSNNPIRRKSKSEAILLVVKNLKEKKLLSPSILRYLVSMSFDFKEYNLFREIIKLVDLSLLERIKWEIFNATYTLRLPIYKIKKRVNK